jgi:DNA-binding NarL/FixJ family response regulator
MIRRPDMVGLDGGPAPGPATARLLVISDDETLAGRAQGVLERDGLVVHIEGAGPDAAAVVGFYARRPTLVLVRRAAGRPGLEDVLEWARRDVPGVPVLVVLPPVRVEDLGRLLSLGADGLLLEQDLESALAPVARALAAGQVSVPAELRHLIQPPALSFRERQILGLAVVGLTNAQIAQRLFISESTVKAHLSSAFRRLGVRSRREAATLVLASDETLRRTLLATLRLSGALAAKGGDS